MQRKHNWYRNCGYALALGVLVSACQTNPARIEVVDDGSGSVSAVGDGTRTVVVPAIVEPCPPEAMSRVEQLPSGPSKADRDSANAGILSILGEERGLSVIEHDQITVPGIARRANQRLTKVQEWCQTRNKAKK